MNLDSPIITQFLADLELEELTNDQKEAFLKQVDELVSQEVMFAIIDTLTEEQTTNLNQLLESTPENERGEVASSWIKTHVPNVNEIIEQALARFYERLKTANGALIEAQIRTAAGLNTTPTPETPIL